MSVYIVSFAVESDLHDSDVRELVNAKLAGMDGLEAEAIQVTPVRIEN